MDILKELQENYNLAWQNWYYTPPENSKAAKEAEKLLNEARNALAAYKEI